MKEYLMVFVLLLLTSEGMSAQVDATAVTTEKRGLKWFIDDGEYDSEKSKFSNWLNTFSLNISGTAKHITLRHGFLSPTVYTGNSFGFLAGFEKTGTKNYWQIGPVSFDWGNLKPRNLDSSLDKKDFTVSYMHSEVTFGSWARRLKKSPHYLGAYFSTESSSLNMASDFNDFGEETNRQHVQGGVYLGILHLYHNELLSVPFRTRIKIPVVASNFYPDGDKRNMHANYNFRTDLLLNKKQNRKWWLSYTWSFFRLKRIGKIYDTSRGSTGILLTLSI